MGDDNWNCCCSFTEGFHSKVDSPYKELYAPSRFHANPDIKRSSPKTLMLRNI